jgi:hypothetical protein
MLARHFHLRRAVSTVIAIHVFTIFALVVYLVLAIIRATHSDTDISDFARNILPAGNCLCESSTVFDCNLSLLEASKKGPAAEDHSPNQATAQWQFQYAQHGLDFGLTPYQCNVAFPGYFEEIYRAVEVRNRRYSNVTVDDLDAIELSKGMVRAMIVDGKLRVLKSKHVDEDHRKKGLAIVYSICRSISPHGRPIPNIEFVFSIEDRGIDSTQPIWTLSRRPQDENLWLMPDFGFWSWDLQDLGTIDDIVEEVLKYESSSEAGTKIQKLVWRGKLQMLPTLRRALLAASKDKSWSDVAGLIPGPSLVPENYLSAVDQCKYMFVAHAEGALLYYNLKRLLF